MADIWYNFQQFSLKTYKLDPNNFVSAPSLSWAAGLKHTGVNLELITEKDNEIYKMFESSIRGGICMAFTRKLIANNKYTNPEFNEEKEQGEFIQYMDASS